MDEREFARMAAVEDRMWWYVGMRAITAALLERNLPQRNGLQILDAGCGTGANLAFLRRYGSVTGCDLAPQALHACHARGEHGITQTTTVRLPFADGAFDLVTSFDVLFMLPSGEDAAAMRELARVTPRGGHVLVRAAAYNWLRGAHDVAWGTQQRYSARGLATLARQAGLQPMHNGYANTLLLVPAMLKRGIETALRLTSGTDTVMPAPLINGILTHVLRCEAAIIRRARLPFGLSAMLLARKP